MPRNRDCTALTGRTGVATMKRLAARFIAWKSGADLKIHFSDGESEASRQTTYRSTGHWTFVMGTFPWTCFQTRGTGNGARIWALVMDTALAAGFLALVVASLAFGVARKSTKVLAIQHTLAGVFGVVYTFDEPRSRLVDVQIQLLAFPAFSLALLGTTAHRLVTQFGTSGRSRVLMASNLF